MSTFSEVGHAKNAANLEDLISRCTAFGASYNPSQTALQVQNLTALKSTADNAVISVSLAKASFKDATNRREVLFNGLKKLSSRLLKSLRSCNVTLQTYNDAAAINRKVQGRGLKKSPAAKSATTVREADPSLPATGAVEVHISTSQQSFDSMVEHFTSWTSLLGTVPAYAPNETDLQLAGLNTLIGSLNAANTAAITAETNLESARVTRDHILYASGTGLVDIAQQVKYYICSVFGLSSPQYKQVSGIKFRPVHH